MPTSTWTCKLSWDDVTYSDPSPGNPDILARAYWINFTVIALPLTMPLPKYNAAVDLGHFDFSVGVDGTGTGFFGMVVQLESGDTDPNFSWASFVEVPRILGATSNFLNGGTIEVTKDFDNDLLTASSPFGTLSLTLSHLDPFLTNSYLNTEPLRPHGYGAFFTTAAPTGFFPEYAVAYHTKFYDIIAQENGVTYDSIALFAADPGHFYSPTANEVDNITPTLAHEIAPWWTFSQETTRQKISNQVTLPDYTSWRQLSYFRRLMTPLEGKKIDLRHAREHGAHWNAYILPSSPSDVLWQRSHDKGHTWTGGAVFAGTDAVDSPSINWAFGKLFVVWYDSTDIVQSVSSDLGQTWGTPVALSISGTNPCHLVDQQTGFSWYFYCDTDKLYVVRSGNFGAQFVDGSPILALDPITTQTVAAQLALDGSLLVSYLDAGAIAQIRSTDLGRTWGAA